MLKIPAFGNTQNVSGHSTSDRANINGQTKKRTDQAHTPPNFFKKIFLIFKSNF